MFSFEKVCIDGGHACQIAACDDLLRHRSSAIFNFACICMGCLGRPSIHACIQRIMHSMQTQCRCMHVPAGQKHAHARMHAPRCTCSVMDPRILEFSDHHALRMHRGCHVHSWHTQFKSRHEIICKAFSKDIAGVYQVVFRPFHPA